MAENQKTKIEVLVPRVLAIETSEKHFATTNASGYFSFGANLPRRKLPFFKVAPISTKLGSGGVLGTRNPNLLLVCPNSD